MQVELLKRWLTDQVWLYKVGKHILYLICALKVCLVRVLTGFQLFSCDLYNAANQENI